MWALRFGLICVALGFGAPLLAWALGAMQTARPGVGRMVAQADALAPPWAALLSSPWLLVSGFGLLASRCSRTRR